MTSPRWPVSTLSSLFSIGEVWSFYNISRFFKGLPWCLAFCHTGEAVNLADPADPSRGLSRLNGYLAAKGGSLGTRRKLLQRVFESSHGS